MDYGSPFEGHLHDVQFYFILNELYLKVTRQSEHFSLRAGRSADPRAHRILCLLGSVSLTARAPPCPLLPPTPGVPP